MGKGTRVLLRLLSVVPRFPLAWACNRLGVKAGEVQQGRQGAKGACPGRGTRNQCLGGVCVINGGLIVRGKGGKAESDTP